MRGGNNKFKDIAIETVFKNVFVLKKISMIK